MNFTVFFLSRSFENNWKIYKLLAHQKVSKEKVRKRAEQCNGSAIFPLPPASWGAGFQVWGIAGAALGLSCVLRSALSFECGYRAQLQHNQMLLKDC